MGKYDPKRKRRKTTRRRKADPKRKRMSRGHGTVGGKPFRRGSRGGAYWSGGRKRRYDPRRGNYRRRISRGAKDIYTKVTNNLNKISGLLGFGMFYALPLKSSFDNAKAINPTYWGNKNILNFIWEGLLREGSQLLGLKGTWEDPMKYLQWKFTSPESAWCRPWQASIGTYIGSNVIRWIAKDFLPKKVITFMKKVVEPIAGAGIIATTFGGLFQFGSDHTTPKPSGNPTSNNPTRYGSTNSRSPQSMYG